MGNLVLVLAVVVHRPDLFAAGTGADEVDFGFGDAVDAATEAEDDVVCELVSDGSGRILGTVSYTHLDVYKRQAHA